MRPILQALVLILLAGCGPLAVAETTTVSFAGNSAQVIAEIVDKPTARNIGLMYRREMAPSHGMLFVFPREEMRSFWMKNTFLELDIIFISASKKIVNVIERARPQSTDSRPSSGPALYVLEILGGKSAEWGLKAGMQISFDPEPAPAAN